MVRNPNGMTLKIKQIRLRNWKCYQDQVIQFNLKTDKKIWLIFGQNGYGKTSLLEAILWCLYGGDAIAKFQLLKMFNRVSLHHNPELSLAVQLQLQTDEGQSYFISRRAQRRVKGITPYVEVEEASFNLDGVERPNSREYIESILPRSCRDFFFFDGVEIQRYAQLTQTTEIRQGIERILGIPELRNLREDAKNAQQVLEKQLREVSEVNQDLKRINTQLSQLQRDIETHTSQIDSEKQQLETAIAHLQHTQELARQSEDLRNQLGELATLETEKKRIEETLKNLESNLDIAIKKAPISFLLGFIQDMATQLQRQPLQTQPVTGSISQLQGLLTQEVCLCGRCIDESVRDYIRQQLKSSENSYNKTKEALEKENLRYNVQLLSRYQPTNLSELLAQRDRFLDNLAAIEQTISRLREETQGVTQQEVIEIWKKVGAAESQVSQKRTTIEQLKQKINKLDKQIAQLTRQREALGEQDAVITPLIEQVKTARGLYQAAEELIVWYVEQAKQNIEAKTTEIYRKITNKPQEYARVVINDDYTLGVETVTGTILNPDSLSAGERETLAFSFITGLNLASQTAAPLIMDTPFGHLDTQHQKNLINALPELPSQVIILATDRDLPAFLLGELRPHVAEIHRIERLTATEDGSRLVSEI